ncbi:MAG: YbeD family protein [Thioalkalivibrio sp.]
MADETLMEFPCDFPLKVMGASVPEFSEQVARIVERHVPATPQSAFSQRLSRGGRYLAITVRVQVHSQAQLDALYRELTACELVTMVL